MFVLINKPQRSESGVLEQKFILPYSLQLKKQGSKLSAVPLARTV